MYVYICIYTWWYVYIRVRQQFSDSKYLRSKNDVDAISRSEDVWKRLEKEVCVFVVIVSWCRSVGLLFSAVVVLLLLLPCLLLGEESQCCTENAPIAGNACS